MTTRTVLLRCGAICVMTPSATVATASAQGGSTLRPPSKPAAVVVTNFERTTAELKAVRPDEVLHPEKYLTSRVDSVLDGLERIARTSNSNFVATSAASAVMEAGAAKETPRGIFDREVRLYKSAKNDFVRPLIVDLMPDQKDRVHALAFLKSVAVQSGTQRDYENAPRRAVEALSRMGHDGRAALAELRDKQLLRDIQARSFALWFLSKNTPRASR